MCGGFFAYYSATTRVVLISEDLQLRPVLSYAKDVLPHLCGVCFQPGKITGTVDIETQVYRNAGIELVDPESRILFIRDNQWV